MNTLGSNLIACRVCGTIMVKLARDICSKCAQEDEALFQKVKAYIRTNPGTSLLEVAKAVGCKEEQVSFYVQSGRLERIGAKINHPCKICQVIIPEGIICAKCKRNLKEQVSILAKASPADASEIPSGKENTPNSQQTSPLVSPQTPGFPSSDKKKRTGPGPGHVGKRKR